MINEATGSPHQNDELSNSFVLMLGQSKTDEAVKNFLEQTNANEIAETLSPMLDAYILQSEASNEAKANAANLVLSLVQLFYNLQNCVK